MSIKQSAVAMSSLVNQMLASRGSDRVMSEDEAAALIVGTFPGFGETTGSGIAVADHMAACLGRDVCGWGDPYCPAVVLKLGQKLCTILMSKAGERGHAEGAVETLLRIINERDNRIEQVKAGGAVLAEAMRGFLSPFLDRAKQAPGQQMPVHRPEDDVSPHAPQHPIPDAEFVTVASSTSQTKV